MRTVREIPPPLELDCLRALWTLGEGNVSDVREVLNSSRNLAYTTVMTVLDRLVRRGGVARRKVGRSFVYSPLLSRDSLRRLAVRELVESFFDGSEDALKLYLLAVPAAAIVSEQATEFTADPAADLRLDASLL